jgi:hypothetical protein
MHFLPVIMIRLLATPATDIVPQNFLFKTNGKLMSAVFFIKDSYLEVNEIFASEKPLVKIGSCNTLWVAGPPIVQCWNL